MEVNLASLADSRGVVTARWECRVLSPALLGAFPALSKAGCELDRYNGTTVGALPSFWPAAVKDAPLDTEMPTHSDQGLRSLRDEADRCWEMAHSQMQDRGEWLRLMGADRCMANALLMPFTELGFSLSFHGKAKIFEALIDELTNETYDPETRLFGYLLCKNTAFRPLTEVPEWVQRLW